MFKKQQALVAGLFIVLFLAVAGCKSKYEKLKASNDSQKKFQEGLKLYNQKQYSKALGLFETLLTRYRGQDGAVELFYYDAYANYKLGDYTSATYHFKEFATNYPSDPRAEECRFLAAYCLYLEAPASSLDQDNSLKCIDALQLYINFYPKGQHVTEASKLIQDLHERLEQKSFDNSNLYLIIGEYQAAVISFGNTLRDYPDTKYAEQIEYLTIKAQYEYAHQSREIKQEDRYNQTATLADQFIEKYPKSTYVPAAKDLKIKSMAGIQHAKNVIAEALSNERIARKLARKDSVFIPISEKPDPNSKMP